MAKHLDHVTIVVRDIEAAKRFFSLLGFREDKAVVISGPIIAAYMGVPDIEADHITLVLEGATPRTELQLLHYRRPHPLPDAHIDDLSKLGFNHICFAVDNLDSELRRLREAGFAARSEVMEFRSRRLVLLRGPEGVAVELSEWR